MKKRQKSKPHHNHQKWRLEHQAAQRLLHHLSQRTPHLRYHLGPHREAPDYELRVLSGPFSWYFVGLEITHLYGSKLDAALLNGSLRPPNGSDEQSTLEEHMARLELIIREKNDKFTNYEIKPCWLLIHNADQQIQHSDWQHYLADKDFSASPYEKIWLITDRQQLINIK